MAPMLTKADLRVGMAVKVTVSRADRSLVVHGVIARLNPVTVTIATPLDPHGLREYVARYPGDYGDTTTIYEKAES